MSVIIVITHGPNNEVTIRAVSPDGTDVGLAQVLRQAADHLDPPTT